MYFNGRGVAQDYKAAAQWYRRAAEQGHAEGQTALGAMYKYGKGLAAYESGDYVTALT